jgi:alkylation response protein AidB-like acyl-CoA dehydrogenase
MIATSEQLRGGNILDAVSAVVRDTLEPAAEEVDRAGVFPWHSLRALAEAGVGGLLMPRDLGGQEARSEVYADAVSAIAAACGSTSTVYMTQMHCAHPILIQGRADQATTWIPRLCSAEAIGSIALTEPDAGSDIASMRTRARRDGDVYVIDGVKTFVSNGDVADVIVLFATVDPHLGRDGITAFLVETSGLAGFQPGRPMKKLGQKGASTVEIGFGGCRIPVSARLGREGEGYALLIRSVAKSRISAAAQGIGFATGAYQATVRYAADRGLLSSGRRDAQDIQFRLAELRSSIFAGHSMLHTVCDLVDASQLDLITEVSMAKLHCTSLGVAVAAACVELLGADGDRVEVGAERRLRDAKITEIYDGTNQVQCMLIARDIRLSAGPEVRGGRACASE